MSCHVYEFEVWTWRTWLYNKFELSNFWKEIKLQTNYKQIFWHCFSNLLFVNCIVLGYSSLNISSTIRDLKLKGMPKYKQVWTCYTYIFAPYIWLAHNYMKIWFRNISSAKLKWKGCTRRIKHDCFFFCIMVDSSWIFHSQLPLTHFSSCFSANYCHLLSFLKKSQNCNVTNFCIISNLFHHKYNDKNFSKGNKKPVSLRNQFPWPNQFPRQTSVLTKPAPPPNQHWMQKSFKPLM